MFSLRRAFQNGVTTATCSIRISNGKDMDDSMWGHPVTFKRYFVLNADSSGTFAVSEQAEGPCTPTRCFSASLQHGECTKTYSDRARPLVGKL